ncbi:oxaloacetate decarboxylase subunit alpha [Garciella nitratireducens]|uniref:Oxaloacetate decarboxylase, alpha subunit n=1 Tax=Garciella nitratireducens DSM 15102 TaxID=1121911 RepID=A0A1T4NCQ6_9FIRM|nr:oxaloacetate decarboxylase subunit alpha [Garciella nitratireducens]SJZ76836.1 oxaloacetate decarboxylase, alpha subunit [Garciella nitratireducens DSM 15102]
MTKVKITETVLRDAHQSLIATRMKTEEMIPILETMDKVGYNAIEMWGGATFDACLRFLKEDPWERLRTIRKHIKNTKLQMLLRGQNLLGYKHYADDVVIEFVKKSIANGIDIIRIFDALNDTRNMRVALETTKKERGHAQAAISYTTSPVHNIEYYVKLAKDMENMGADSICIKDMAGILTPYHAYELIQKIKKIVKIPIELHTHATSGVGSLTYLKGIEAGVDIIDTAISPLAMGSSQPPTESFVVTLQGTEYDTGLDLSLLNQIAEYFKPIRQKYLENGLLNPNVLGVDVNALIYQVPGGMLSNLVSQLKMQNAEDKLEEVLKEVPRVREDLGYPPLVTPMSQMVGTQAVFNVLLGERYKMIPKEIKAYVRGEYGKPTVEISQEIRKKIIGEEEVITYRPADRIPPQLEDFHNQMKEYEEQEEDILSYALFPKVAEEFFKYRQTQKYKIDYSVYDEENKVHPV